MDEGNELAPFGPAEVMKKLVTVLIPPACREEIAGDLHETCKSSAGYICGALRVLPMVLYSRVRRTADVQVLLMQTVSLFLAFAGAGWNERKTVLFGDSGLLSLAIPTAWILLGVILDDVYSLPGKRSYIKRMGGTVFGAGLAYVSQFVLSVTQCALALPADVMLFGSVAGLIFAVTVRSLFSTPADRPIGTGAPAAWLKYTVEPPTFMREATSIAKTLAFVSGIALVGGHFGGGFAAVVLVMLFVVVLVFRELRRR